MAGSAFESSAAALRHHARVLPGWIGETLPRGSGCMAAYRNPPQATAETIDAQGWLRTGDAGSVDADRYLYIEHRVSVDVAAEFQKGAARKS